MRLSPCPLDAGHGGPALRAREPASLAPNAALQVDSFQGKQVDVVMLSCVRAGAHGGLGFVNDVRRWVALLASS